MDASRSKIQIALPEDIEALTTFWRSIDGVGVGRGDDQDSLNLFLRMNPTTCLLVREDEKIVGSVWGGFDGRRGYIYHLAVSPNKRGQGLGRALTDMVCGELEKQGAHKIHLFVFNDNPDAISFYQRLGWTRRTDIQVVSTDRCAKGREC